VLAPVAACRQDCVSAWENDRFHGFLPASPPHPTVEGHLGPESRLRSSHPRQPPAEEKGCRCVQTDEEVGDVASEERRRKGKRMLTAAEAREVPIGKLPRRLVHHPTAAGRDPCREPRL